MSCVRALAIVFLFASPAVALKRPQTKAELAELAAISAKMASEKTAFETSLQLLKDAYNLVDGKIDKEPEIAALKQKFAALNAAHAVVMTDIVKRTVVLYDIQPGPTSGHIVGGAFMNSSPQWSPIFAPQVEQKIVQVPGKPSIPLSAHGPYAGITWADGSVEINEKAFLSPGYLAAVILHESVHFAQMTTLGRGDRITAVRAEIEAHSKSSGPEAAAALGLTSDEEDKLKAAFTDNIKRFQNNPSRNMMSMQFASPTSPEPTKEKSDLDFLDSLRQGGAAVSELTNAAEAARARELEKRAQLEEHKAEVWAREAERKARLDAERLERLNTPWGALLEWAGTACAYMGYYPETVPINYQDVSAANLRYIAWAEQENERRLSIKRRTDAAGKQYMLTHSVVMTRTEISAQMNLEGNNLSRCSRSVVEMIQDAPDPIDSQWLVAQLDYKRTGGVFGAVIRGISSALGNAAGALIHGIKAPFVNDGSRSEGSSSGGGNGRESSGGGTSESGSSRDGERSTRMPDGNGVAFRQLRGIANGARFQ